VFFVAVLVDFIQITAGKISSEFFPGCLIIIKQVSRKNNRKFGGKKIMVRMLFIIV